MLTFCKQPWSAPALGLLSPQAEAGSPSVCPVPLIKPQTGDRQTVRRDVLRGSRRGFCQQPAGYLPVKWGHVPAGCIGERGWHLRDDAEERLWAAMVKDRAGSSSDSTMAFSQGEQSWLRSLPGSSSMAALCKETPSPWSSWGWSQGRELNPEPHR